MNLSNINIEFVTRTRTRTRKNSSTKEYNKKPRIYMHINDENILENLAFRHHRPIKLYKEILKKLEETHKTKFQTTWSQNAGCSCGCSPGFILNNAPELNLNNTDSWITLSSHNTNLKHA